VAGRQRGFRLLEKLLVLAAELGQPLEEAARPPARRRGSRPIIPFRIENSQLQKGLRMRLADLHWIDGYINREEAFDTLIRALAEEDAS
jgi:hypothetical protein